MKRYLRTKLILSLTTALVIAVLFLPTLVYATDGLQAVKDGITKSGNTGGITMNDAPLPVIIGRAINYLFGILGVVFLTVVLVGGYLWMTTSGNEEKVGKAKMFVINGINGMLVIFLAYALVYTILSALRMAITGASS